MNELDLLIEKHYQKKKKEVFSLETLLEMVEDVIGDFQPVLREAKSPQKMTYDLSLIPMPEFSELGWGTINTPKNGGVRASTDPRSQLAQYMANIGGTDLRTKIEALNQFYSGEMAPENFESQSDKISKYLSYLVVYKTLTSIFTGFNASSAGFLFEPWLAIMLDAESGQQIPATGQDGDGTIADFTIYKGGKPISLKAYGHKQLKVGGSFRQLITDLTGKSPIMEYIAVTKEMRGDKSDPASVTGDLHFKSFNFTLENVADIIFKVSGNTHKQILELPLVFWDEDIVEKLRDGDFIENLRTPKNKEISVPDLMKQYDAIFEEEFFKAGLREELGEIRDDFYDLVVDPQTGEYRQGSGLHLKKPTAPLTNKGKVTSRYKAFAEQYPENAQAIISVLQSVHERWVPMTGSATKGSARGEKTKQLEYQSPEKTYIRLKQIQKSDSEAYKTALTYLRGVVFSDQFDLTESSLDANIASVGGDNLFSYGSYYVGTLTIGRENIQQVLERCINELNTSILDIFSSLRGLSDTINKYVSSGLEDDRLITDPQSGARAEAQNIDKKSAEIVDPDRKTLQPGAGGVRSQPGGRMKEQKQK
jgi:hypothetical protein